MRRTTGRVASRRLLALVLLATLTRPAPAAVTLRLEAEARFEGAPALALSAINAGDEAAQAVIPEIVYRHRTVEGDEAVLAPRATHAWQVPLPGAPHAGTFPATIRLRYRDLHGVPGEVPLVTLIRMPDAPASTVRATLTVDPVVHVGAARLLLDNPARRAVAGRLFFVLAPGLGTDPESQPVQVPGEGRTVVPMLVENRGAAAATANLVYAVFQYTEDGTPHAVLAAATVTVVAGAARGLTVPLVVGGIALALVLILLAFAWRRAAARQSALDTASQQAEHCGKNEI